MLIVNAATTAGEFYQTTVTGLCPNTPYEFSAWVINLGLTNTFCGTGIIPINVKFEIRRSSDNGLIVSGDTGSISATSSSNPLWEEYGLVFRTGTETSVILKMINNGSGGCGNDLAIDDIEFKSCGDFVSVTDSANNNSASLCSTDTPYITTLTANPDFTVYSSHFYQWEESADFGVTWSDIVGEINQSILISTTNTRYYRAKIAEVATNLDNSQCVSFSNQYQATVAQLPPMPFITCWETANINETTCSWEVTGSQPIQPSIACWETATFNTSLCTWIVTGTQPLMPTSLQCWETVTFNSTSCSWEVTGTQPVQPVLECWESTTFNTTSCSWEVVGIQSLMPTGLNCWETATFNNINCLWETTGTQPVQPTLKCWESASFNSMSCSWEVIGTRPVEPVLECWETAMFNASLCSWNVTGTQPVQPILKCWETTSFNTDSCIWDVTGIQPGNIIEQNLELCEGQTLLLSTETHIANPSFIWSTGEINEDIIIDSAGTYTLEVVGTVCSFETWVFNITLLEMPIIRDVNSDGENIEIITNNIGDFQYSIDGKTFQSSNTFYNIEGGVYTIYVKQLNCDNIVITEYLHFYIPKFFTPNGDGINDLFSLGGLDFYNSSQVSIFNRYGKLLKFSRNSAFSWDGTYRGEHLLSDDYWYEIVIEDQKYTGHFTLKR